MVILSMSLQEPSLCKNPHSHLNTGSNKGSWSYEMIVLPTVPPCCPYYIRLKTVFCSCFLHHCSCLCHAFFVCGQFSESHSAFQYNHFTTLISILKTISTNLQYIFSRALPKTLLYDTIKMLL